MNSRHHSPALEGFIRRFQLQMPQASGLSHHVRPAAVLIPIICRPTPTLLLTLRASTLRKHAGQVAFPGGKCDPQDGSPIITALREAQEEVAIFPNKVQILGQLAPLDSSSGFQVTPVVGLLPADVEFQANQDEVAAVFEIPLHEALMLGRYSALDVRRAGRRHRIYLSWYQGHFVWGLTATILRRMALQVSSVAHEID